MWEWTLVVSGWRKFFGTKIHGGGMIVQVELSTTLATHGNQEHHSTEKEQATTIASVTASELAMDIDQSAICLDL